MSIFNFIFSLKSFFLIPISAIVFGGIVTSVDMSPSSLAFQVGAVSQIQATARDASGQVVQGVTFQWSSRNVNIATVDQAGNVTGVSVGTTTVVATAPNGVHNPATVNVIPATATPSLTPTPGASCIPSITITEDVSSRGDNLFDVTAGVNSATINSARSQSGLQSLTLVNATNAVVTVPVVTPDTTTPVTVTYTITNPNQPVDITLRATGANEIILIRLRCGSVTPTPTPTPGGGLTSFSGRATSVNATLNGVNMVANDTGPLPSQGGVLRIETASSNMFENSLITGPLDAGTQAAFDQSRSGAIVYALTLMLNGNIFASDILSESSQCSCLAANSPPVCDGGIFANLRMDGVPIPITGEPNQRVNLPRSGYVIINEQTITRSGNSAELVANGFHFIVPGQADIIFSSAQSGIFCGSNLSPEEESEEK